MGQLQLSGQPVPHHLKVLMQPQPVNIWERKRGPRSQQNPLTAGLRLQPHAHTHTLLAGLWDELPLAVDAGVGALAGDALLPLRHVPGRGRAPAGVLGTWDKDTAYTAADWHGTCNKPKISPLTPILYDHSNSRVNPMVCTDVEPGKPNCLVCTCTDVLKAT